MTSAIYCGKLINIEILLFVPVYHRAVGLSMETPDCSRENDHGKEVLGVKKCRSHGSLARVLSVVVLLCFALGLLFALSHHCGGEDCPLCLLNEGSKEKLWIPVVCFILFLYGNHFEDGVCNRNLWVTLTEETLVKEKVKLSN